jgi:hypothetical protein
MLQQLDIAIAFVTIMLMLSLLVTAAVQVISALLDLRGKNLVRALTDLFQQMDEGLRQIPTDVPLKEAIRGWLTHPFSRVTLGSRLADSVTTHPTIAHTYARAKAIRKDELFNLLTDLASTTSAGTIDPVVRTRLNEILAKRLPGGTETVVAAQAIADKLAVQFPEAKDKDKVTAAVSAALGQTSRLEIEIEKWFDTVMDRASDIFTRWTRITTIVVSASLVIVLHIDSGLIFHQISMNPDIRAGLSKLSDTALAQADETLRNGNRATAALKEVAAQHTGDATVAATLNAAPSLATCADGKNWLEKYGKEKMPDFNNDRLQDEFSRACQEQTMAALERSRDQISNIRRELAETNLHLVPERISGRPVFSTDSDHPSLIRNWAEAYGYRPHILGTLAMVVLLSLGAPFWFNALRQLSNLKPAISNKIEKETAAV